METTKDTFLSVVRSGIRNNTLFFIAIIVVLLLLYGLVATSGTMYAGKMAVYILTFSVAYVVFNRFLFRKTKVSRFSLPPNYFNPTINLIILFVAVFQVLHYYMIGAVPAVKSILSNDFYEIARIRQDIKSVDSALINYSSSFLLKAVIPVLLFLLYYRDRKKFWLLLAVGAFYSFALMQKAFIVTILLPLIVGFLLEREWKKTLFYLFFSFGVVAALTVVSNPSLRGGPPQPVTEQPVVATPAPHKAVRTEQYSAPVELVVALYERVFITTGEMVGNWFYYIPDTLPYLKGNGYRLIGGSDYRDYSREIYDKLKPGYAAMGFTGTATTAYFMYDYSNFGVYGLMAAGIYLALLLVWLKSFFGADRRSLVALNSVSLIWLSSAAFTTTLFSGGWILTILLYWFFRPYFVRLKEQHA